MHFERSRIIVYPFGIILIICYFLSSSLSIHSGNLANHSFFNTYCEWCTVMIICNKDGLRNRDHGFQRRFLFMRIGDSAFHGTIAPIDLHTSFTSLLDLRMQMGSAATSRDATRQWMSRRRRNGGGTLIRVFGFPIS